MIIALRMRTARVAGVKQQSDDVAEDDDEMPGRYRDGEHDYDYDEDSLGM